MKTAPESITSLCFLQIPEDQGQPSQTAWAYDPESDRLIRRTFDWDENSRGGFCNLRHEYRSFEQGRRGDFDPINGKINPIGNGRYIGCLKQ